jgi:hypothetical protein
MDSKHPQRLALRKVRINQADFLRPCKTSWNSFRARDKLPRRPSLFERESGDSCAPFSMMSRERKMLSSKRSAPKLIYQRESLFSFSLPHYFHRITARLFISKSARAASEFACVKFPQEGKLNFPCPDFILIDESGVCG